MLRSERNIKWVQRYCRTPEGMHAGKPIILREWQRDELRKIYDNPHGTRQAIISLPRKNAKSTLTSFLLLLHLCGPEAKANSQLYSAAQSKEQAATVFMLAAKVVRQSPELNAVVGIRDTMKQLFCAELGTLYSALSAEKSTAHGKSPIFAVHDELGQVKGPVSDLYDAIETGMGAHQEPLSIVISTQAPTDNDLLSRLIDKALTGADPRTTCTIYSAPMDADPFSIDTLKECNPAWGDFLNDEEVIRTMRAAQVLPSQEPSYRNLHLNQRVNALSTLFSKSVWMACNTPAKPLTNVPVYAGLDLSSVNDLTSFEAIGQIDGVWNVESYFWLPGDTIRERARTDRQPYDVWHDQGFLLAAPGKSVDYQYISTFLRGFCDSHDVRKIGFDRYNFKFLLPWLLEAGFTQPEIDAIFVEFGQGYLSMSPAIRELEGDMLNQRVAHGGHPVLTMCNANAIVTTDPAGNRKLDKSKAIGRIDGMVALVMAKGVAPMQDTTPVLDIDAMVA